MSFGGDGFRQKVQFEIEAVGGDVADEMVTRQQAILESARLMMEAFASGQGTIQKLIADLGRMNSEYDKIERYLKSVSDAQNAAYQQWLSQNANQLSQSEVRTRMAAEEAAAERDLGAVREALARKAEADGREKVRAILEAAEAVKRANAEEAEAERDLGAVREALARKAEAQERDRIEEIVRNKQEAAAAEADAQKKVKDAIDASTKNYTAYADQVERSNDKMTGAGQRYADSLKRRKEVEADIAATQARIASQTRAHADAEAQAALASSNYAAAMANLNAVIARHGANSDEARAAVARLQSAEADAAAYARALADGNRELADAYTRLINLQGMARQSQNDLGASSQNLSRLLIFSAQGVEDLMYGWSAFVNNVPLIVNSLGTVVGLTPPPP